MFTFVVTLAVVGKFPVATPVIAALTLGLMVYIVGHISGAHLNPAVTIGMWSIRKTNSKDAVAYIVAQFLGALLTYYVVRSILGVVPMAVNDNWGTLLAEFLGAMIFLFGVSSVVFGHAPSDMSGIGVGAALLVGLVVASVLGSNAVLNPVMAFSIGSFSWGYVFAPVLGSIVGMNLYKWLSEMKNS